MLRTIFTCFLVLSLTKHTVNSSSLDGGLAYITKHMNKQNVVVPIIPSRVIPANHMIPSVNVDQEEIPVSKAVKAPANQRLSLLSSGAAPTSFPPTVSNTTSVPQQEFSIANANFIGQKIKSITSNNPLPNVNKLPKSILQIKSVSEPAKVSIVEAITIPQDSSIVTPPPFIISITSAPRQEIAIVAPKYIPASRTSAQQFPKPFVSSPLTEYSTVAPSCPLETTKHVEVQKSTPTSTTIAPTTMFSTTTVTSPSPSPCRNGEVFPMNTGSCDQFLMCHNSVIVLMICPQGMGFDIQKNRCEWSQVVPGCKAQDSVTENN